jgi:hypothetical protein
MAMPSAPGYFQSIRMTWLAQLAFFLMVWSIIDMMFCALRKQDG